MAPEQAGALPQSGGLVVAAMVARRKAAGAFPYRTHSKLAPFNRTHRRARHARGRTSQIPTKVSGRFGRIAAAGINAAICGEPPGSIRSCKSPAAITAKWVSGLRGAGIGQVTSTLGWG
jgi:hypothetical protein